MKKAITSVGLLALCAGSAMAQTRELEFYELHINPVSPASDNGREFFELRSTDPSFNMNGYWIVVIDGDNNAAGDSIATGVIDQVLPLSGKSTGANRLFMWRDSATVLDNSFDPGIQGPDPQTSIFIQDFAPDIENGSATYLIVQGFTGNVGQDLDTDNDGVLNTTPWTRVVDAIAFLDGDDVDANIPAREYATQLGGVDLSDRLPGVATGFTPDALTKVCGAWITYDTLGVDPGPYIPDSVNLEVIIFRPGQAGVNYAADIDPNFLLTPGRANFGDDNCTTGPTCDGIDFNGDGIENDPTDIEAFLSVYSGGPCIPVSATCGDIDFNNDGIENDPTDIEAFLSVYSGGPCF